MRIGQDQLIDDYRAQRQQLRPPPAFEGHSHAPLTAGLAQAIERFNGLRARFVEPLAHFGAAIAVGIRPAACSDSLPAPWVTLLTQLGRIVRGIASM
ncbi:MAG TPA: hypothetical protein VIH59_11410 [Candidatus Tectomicrobia bacterium]|jgi:hypothetical protein